MLEVELTTKASVELEEEIKAELKEVKEEVSIASLLDERVPDTK